MEPRHGQAGLGPGCHEGPATALLQASTKPEPRLHVNTSCVKTAQLLLGQQTAVGLLGNRPPNPNQAPLSLPLPANPLLAPQLYWAFFHPQGS